jgi:hypothetical protein
MTILAVEDIPAMTNLTRRLALALATNPVILYGVVSENEKNRTLSRLERP